MAMSKFEQTRIFDLEKTHEDQQRILKDLIMRVRLMEMALNSFELLIKKGVK